MKCEHEAACHPLQNARRENDAYHKEIGGIKIEHSIALAELDCWRSLAAKLRVKATTYREAARQNEAEGFHATAASNQSIAVGLEMAAKECDEVFQSANVPRTPDTAAVVAMLRRRAAEQREVAEAKANMVSERSTRCLGTLYESFEADAIAAALEEAADEAERMEAGEQPEPKQGDGGGL